MSEEPKSLWLWSPDIRADWVEVFEVDYKKRKGGNLLVAAVDRRVDLFPNGKNGAGFVHRTLLYDTKPEAPPKPAERGGTRIQVAAVRTVSVRVSGPVTYYGANRPVARWEVEDTEAVSAESADRTVEIRIESISGWDATHVCGTCREFSTSQPDRYLCRACGTQTWVPWVHDSKVYPLPGDEISCAGEGPEEPSVR